MKNTQDTQTQELPILGVANPPAFDLDHNDPWPMPTAQPVKPDGILEPLKRWIERVQG